MRVNPDKDSGGGLVAGMLRIFGLLLPLYLLTFSGSFTAIDELALYVRAESLVQQGSLDVPQLYFSSYHNPVGALEPGLPILLAPLYWLAQQHNHFNSIQMALLFNPFCTAITAALVYAIGRRLGYSSRGATVAALAYGLASLAWPYTRSLYREPLVGLGWATGLYGLVAWRYGGRPVWGLVAGMALVFTLAVKVTALVGLPFILLAALARSDNRQRLVKVLILLLVILAGAGALVQILAVSRFGSAWNWQRVLDWHWQTGLLRIYGQLFSPGKGLVFYAPAVLLVGPGLAFTWRRHRAVSLAIAMTLLALAAAYSSYRVWYGGQSWGPRFLVPALPLLMVPIAALWDGRPGRLDRGVCLALLLASGAIQLSVVTADWWVGYKPLYESASEPEDTTGLRPTNVHLSPPLVQLRNWRPRHLDLLWLYARPDGSWVYSAWLATGLGLAVIVAAGGVLASGGRRLPPAWPVVPSALAVAALLGWGPAATRDQSGLPTGQGRELAAWAAEAQPPSYTLVTVSNEFGMYYYLGFLKGDFTHYWYSPAQTSGFEAVLQETAHPWLSLVVDRVHVQPENSGKDMEWWLNEQFYRASSQWIGDFEVVRYADLRAADWRWYATHYDFGRVFAIVEFALNRQQGYPGEVLGVQLKVRRSGPWPSYHHLFLHLVGPGVQITGHDGPIRYGGTVALTWQEGEELLERRALLIPADAAPGRYDLIMGFETPEGRLPVTDAAGVSSEYAILTQIDILPEP